MLRGIVRRKDPEFGTDKFREFLAEEICSYMAREYAKKSSEFEGKPCGKDARSFFSKLALIRNAIYTLHTALNQ
jgi:hypothetical protein